MIACRPLVERDFVCLLDWMIFVSCLKFMWVRNVVTQPHRLTFSTTSRSPSIWNRMIFFSILLEYVFLVHSKGTIKIEEAWLWVSVSRHTILRSNSIFLSVPIKRHDQRVSKTFWRVYDKSNNSNCLLIASDLFSKWIKKNKFFVWSIFGRIH